MATGGGFVKTSELISQLQVLLKRDGDKNIHIVNNNIVHGPDEFYIRYDCTHMNGNCLLEIMYVNEYGDAIK